MFGLMFNLTVLSLCLCRSVILRYSELDKQSSELVVLLTYSELHIVVRFYVKTVFQKLRLPNFKR